METKEQRGKRRSASRFEAIAILIAMTVIGVIIWGGVEDNSPLVTFGATAFIGCLGYAASMRGADAWANVAAGKM